MTQDAQENRIVAALCYPLGIVALVTLLVNRQQSPFMRHHVWQGLFWNLAWLAAGLILSVVAVVPVLGWIVALVAAVLMPPVGLGLSLWLAWRTYQGEQFALPYLGDLVRHQVGMKQA